MTGALNALRQDIVSLLREYGLHAVTAMDSANRKNWDGPVAAVSLSRVLCTSGGFRDYLGQRKNPDTGDMDELYGKAVELTFSLDLYAPRNGGESACQEAAAVMAEAFACHTVSGLSVREIKTGQVEFLERDGLYRMPVSCLCKGWMVAVVDNSGTFVDFEVKGSRI